MDLEEVYKDLENPEKKTAQMLTSHILNLLIRRVHSANHTWWHDTATGTPITRNR